jgi:hypothetical protein
MAARSSERACHAGREGAAEQVTEQQGERDSYEPPGLGAGDAGEEGGAAHPGIDHHRDGAQVKQGEHGRDQRQAGRHHYQRAVAGGGASGFEAYPPGGHLRAQFGEGKREVIDVARARGPPRHLEGGGLRPGLGGAVQVLHDVRAGGRHPAGEPARGPGPSNLGKQKGRGRSQGRGDAPQLHLPPLDFSHG